MAIFDPLDPSVPEYELYVANVGMWEVQCCLLKLEPHAERSDYAQAVQFIISCIPCLGSLPSVNIGEVGLPFASFVNDWSSNHVFCGAGDSRLLVLHSDGSFTPMSHDHKPNDAMEMARVRRAGGDITRADAGPWRVDGRLALSRAFGDFVRHLDYP